LFLDHGHRFRRNATQLGVGLAGGDLHIEPALELGFLTPDATHVWEGVTLDQGRAWCDVALNLWVD
jgi:hypothetical protein